MRIVVDLHLLVDLELDLVQVVGALSLRVSCLVIVKWVVLELEVFITDELFAPSMLALGRFSEAPNLRLDRR